MVGCLRKILDVIIVHDNLRSYTIRVLVDPNLHQLIYETLNMQKAIEKYY